MKECPFEISENPLQETMRKLNCLIQKPEWIETVERQQRLFDVGFPIRSMLTEYSNILSCAPSYPAALNGLTAGLNTYKYLLDVHTFSPNEHIAGMQAMLTSVADSLSVC